MQDNNRLIAHLFALGTTIVWGTTFISSKILLESLAPSEIIVYRFAIAIAFLYLLRPHFFRHGRGWRMEAAFAGAGLSGVSVYFLFENTALTYTYASNVGVIICTAPFFTGLASAIVFRDKLQGNFFWGFLVAMVGICLISFNDRKRPPAQSPGRLSGSHGRGIVGDLLHLHALYLQIRVSTA